MIETANEDFINQTSVNVDNEETDNDNHHDITYKPDQKQTLSMSSPHTQTTPNQSLPLLPSHGSMSNNYLHPQQQQQIPQYYPPYTSQIINPYQYPPPSQQNYYQQYPSPSLLPAPSIPIVENVKKDRTNSWIIPATLAATAGTLIGVSVAATVRWLNGDDWYFVASNPRMTEQASENNKDESETMLEDHTSTAHNTKTERRYVTDQAMEFLRQQKQLDNINSNHNMESQLRGIQLSLVAIQESLQIPPDQDSDHQNLDRNVELQSHLSSVLMKLEGILDSTNDVAVSQIIESTPNTEPTKIQHTEPIEELDPMVINESDVPVVVTASNSTSHVPVTSASSRLVLREALTKLVMGRPDQSQNDFNAGIQSLYLFTLNISRQPHVPRYRRIYCENENYRSHVQDLYGATDLLSAVGFEQSIPTHPRTRTSKYWDWLPTSSSRRESHASDIEAMYLERLNEALVVLEVVKGASHDTGNHDLLQQALTAAQLIEDNATLDMNNDSNISANVATTHS